MRRTYAHSLAAVVFLALVAGAAGVRPATAVTHLNGPEYQVALGRLCVDGVTRVEGASAALPAPLAARLTRALGVLRPLLARARGVSAPAATAAQHRALLRSLDTLVGTATTLSRKLRSVKAPAAAAAVVRPYAKKLETAAGTVRTTFASLGVWPCVDLFTEVEGSLAIDVRPPVARAVAATARAGAVVALRYAVTDDSGVARVTLTLTLGKRRAAVAPTTTAFAAVRKGVTYRTVWHSPAGARGKLTYCVQAQDRAGNRSAKSCALLTLR
jgi:hypothetical protein